MAITLHFGSPKVYMASSLLFEVADFGTKLGAQATEKMALMAERMGGTADLTQGYTVSALPPAEEKPKRLMLNLNVDAPIVFVPSRTEEKAGPTIVVDLGHVVVSHDSGEQSDTVPDFANFIIDMNDLNVFITEGDNDDRAVYEDGAVIKKFGMHFVVGVRNSQNPELPATRLSGKLPEMNVFVTKEKLRDILIVASSMLPPQAAPALPAPSQATTKTVVTPVRETKKEFVLEAFFSIEAFNLILRDTTESETRRGTALARISFNGLETNFAMTNEAMNLEVKLDRLRIKDRMQGNKKHAVTKNLVASPKGTCRHLLLLISCRSYNDKDKVRGHS
jgi:hypothetical protein